MSFHVDAIAIPSGHDYTRIVTKGITASSWNGTARTLSMTLANPAGSLVEIHANTGALPPSGVTVSGAAVPNAASREAFEAATGSAWWFDGSANLLRVKALQGSGPTALVANFGAADAQAPSVPGGLAANAASPNRVDLSWSAATDNLGVAAYTVFRDGAAIATVDAPATAYADTSAAPATAYSYAVDAVDAAGNHSAKSAPASATTPGLSTLTVAPDADAYTSSGSPASNYGNATALRADVSPTIRSYLRFTVGGLAGPVTKATLRVYSPNAHSVGYDVGGVADTGWGETAITHDTAPAVGAKVGSSGPIAAGTWTSVDVTPLIAGNGISSLALTTPSNTAMSLSSRESANPPQLVVESSSGPVGDTQAPSVPGGLGASPVSQTRIDLAWSASTDNIGVTGYTIYRNGAALASVGGSTTSYADTTAAPATTYSYAVDAVDGAGNRSAKSGAASATTPGGSGVVTTTLAADAYTKSDQADINFGTTPTLRTDASPVIRSFLRFTVSGLGGPVTKAILRVYAPSAHNAGYDAFRVADNGWGETAITHTNQPALGTKLGSSGAIVANTWTSVDVTPYITGNGAYSLALTTLSNTAMSLSSRESANAPQLLVESGGGPVGDTQAPSVPTGLGATPVSQTRIDLSWTPSTDDVGVSGYAIYRDGAPLASVGGSTTSYSDTTVAAGTSYSYAVDAVDAAGNRSAKSASAGATTPTGGAASVTVPAVADAYTSSDAPGANYGSATMLRTDASPVIRSFVRFTVSGLTGPATKATLRIYGSSAHSTGYDVWGVADTSWGETAITHTNQPALGAKLGSSGPIGAGSWTTVDVTPYVTGNGTYSLALTTVSNTAMSLASRESANAPKLVVES
jgi:fibronectin type 3 domain-containing protein